MQLQSLYRWATNSMILISKNSEDCNNQWTWLLTGLPAYLNHMPPVSCLFIISLLLCWTQMVCTSLSVNVSAVWGGTGWTKEMMERKRNATIHQSIHQMSWPLWFNFLSMFHLSANSVCLCAAVSVMVSYLKNESVIGMFHSVLKHAEHRTLNTYTQQLVLSKCRFFLFFFSFFIQSGFRLHRTQHNQSHQVGHIANFVYMSCMPHRWYNVYTKITPMRITV